MPKLSDLGLTTDAVGEALDYATMTDQFGAYPDPPQPGTFRFRFPTRLEDMWETFDHATGKPAGKRVRAKFDDSHPLTIIQSPQNKYDGEPFQTSITNAERPRGKREDPTTQYISDMDYMNRDVWGMQGKPPGGNKGYADTFIKYASVPPTNEFTADVEWNWFCNDKKDIFVDNGQGGYTQVTGTKGCGTSYYQKDIEKVRSNPEDAASPLIYPVRIACSTCGANVRAFANLTRFRP